MSATASSASAPAAAVPGTSILQPFTPQQLLASAQASAIIRGTMSGASVRSGRRFTQLTQSIGATPVIGQSLVVSPQPVPVGLQTKYIAEVVVTITNPAAGSVLTRTPMGPAAVCSAISYTDPNQTQRINTSGWHLFSVGFMRRRRVPGSANATDSPTGFGATLSPIAAPATIAAGASGTLRMIYEIPLSIGAASLRGAVVAGTVFSNQQLALTLSPNIVAPAGTDPLLSCYTGAGAGVDAPTMAATVNFYQVYYDTFSRSLLTPLAPDLSTVYELKSSIFSPIIAGQDNYFRFNPLREFWSTMLAFNNGGSYNAGTDINYFKLQAANQTNFWQRSPNLQSYMSRNSFGDDPPAGVYAFDMHDDPVVTAAEGNTLLILNPITAGAGSTVTVGWEDVGIASVLAAAPSLTGQAGVA